MNHNIAWPITFRAIQEIKASPWGDTYPVGASFEVKDLKQRRVHISKALSQGAAPIYDYGNPGFWLHMGFRAFDNWGHRVYWAHGHWHYKKELPTRFELLMELV